MNQGASIATVRGRTISHSARIATAAQPTITIAMVVAVIPEPAEIRPTAGEMIAAMPLLHAPRTDAAVPAALPCRSSASTCTHGNVKPHAVMNSQSGITVPQKPAPTRSHTMKIGRAACRERGEEAGGAGAWKQEARNGKEEVSG